VLFRSDESANATHIVDAVRCLLGAGPAHEAVTGGYSGLAEAGVL